MSGPSHASVASEHTYPEGVARSMTGPMFGDSALRAYKTNHRAVRHAVLPPARAKRNPLPQRRGPRRTKRCWRVLRRVRMQAQTTLRLKGQVHSRIAPAPFRFRLIRHQGAFQALQPGGRARRWTDHYRVAFAVGKGAAARSERGLGNRDDRGYAQKGKAQEEERELQYEGRDADASARGGCGAWTCHCSNGQWLMGRVQDCNDRARGDACLVDAVGPHLGEEVSPIRWGGQASPMRAVVAL